MIQLFYDRGCPFCQIVLRYLEQKDIPFEHKEIQLWADSPEKRELVERGGKPQVPFLVDPDQGTQMYESRDILDYLQERNSDSAPV